MTSSGEVLRLPSFALFWSAATLRMFGTTIAGVAFQVLIVTVLDATPVEISILSALSVVPYLFLGLIVGALMDRWRRQRTLVITSIGRAIALASVAILFLLDALTIWSLGVVILALGVLTLFADSAAQPFLPHVVPRGSLVMANARLGQSETVAATAGPALGGALLNLVGAPILFVIDAVINAVAAVLQARILGSWKRLLRAATTVVISGTRSSKECGTPIVTGRCAPSHCPSTSGSSRTASS